MYLSSIFLACTASTFDASASKENGPCAPVPPCLEKSSAELATKLPYTHRLNYTIPYN
uniref:Uncharacterized protein n=1 Tax=Arundo donax TaxID=35708 RepID=A0A0A9DLY4_ARUDO